MKSHGNGATEVCANNLLQLVRGEVPFDRIRGLDPALIDKPISSVRPDIEMGAEWIIENYEPRAKFAGVNFKPPDETGLGLLVEAILAKQEG